MISSAGKVTTLVYTYFILFSVIFLGIVFTSPLKFSAETSMSGNMSGMMGMSGMHGMSGNMSGMMGMSRILGISSNEKMYVFLEWMFVLVACLVGIPFAWVIISEKRKKNSNQTNVCPKCGADKT